MTAYRDDLEHLADELRVLDLVIRLRLPAMTPRSEQGQVGRAVFVSHEEVDWLLAPAEPETSDAALIAELNQLTAEIDDRVRASLEGGAGLALPVLGKLFGLSAFELKAVVICLAPELRRKYDRLYAYLQDDITRKRPSVELILRLLCRSERERWIARRHFTDSAPLLRAEIVRRIDDPNSPSGNTGLAQFLALDPRICQFLLGEDEIDARLLGRARLDRPVPGPRGPDVTGLLRLAEHHLRPGGSKLVFAVHGPAGAGKRTLAADVCAGLKVPLLAMDADWVSGSSDPDGLLRILFREGLLRQSAILLSDVDALPKTVWKSLMAAIAELGWLVFLTAEQAWSRGHEFDEVMVHPVPKGLPDAGHAEEIWRDGLAGHTRAPDAWAAELAGWFQLPPGRIHAAIALADNHRLMRDEPLTLADVFAACRGQSNQKLAELAVRVEPRTGWDDLVLPPDRMTCLRDICAQVRHRHRVYDGWGFGSRIGYGKGLSALFTGPPGTGKTMAAEVLARDLELHLYKVDLSGVVSKYVGETEKNLARIFDEAQTSNSILFFDEADALFGKRTEVSDAHDRYANIETSYLLQKMEEYEGVVVLATNLRQNLDEAFTRRIRFVVEFPFPGRDSRARIWRTLFPPAAPVGADVDFTALAGQFEVAGGNIKNIVLNAAFLAAADGGVITRQHILRGTRREFEKIGKLWPVDELTASG